MAPYERGASHLLLYLLVYYTPTAVEERSYGPCFWIVLLLWQSELQHSHCAGMPPIHAFTYDLPFSLGVISLPTWLLQFDDVFVKGLQTQAPHYQLLERYLDY